MDAPLSDVDFHLIMQNNVSRGFRGRLFRGISGTGRQSIKGNDYFYA